MDTMESLLNEEDISYGENTQKYEELDVPATSLQGRVRSSLKKGLLIASTEAKREILEASQTLSGHHVSDRVRHIRLRGLYCSWERITQNLIFRK